MSRPRSVVSRDGMGFDRNDAKSFVPWLLHLVKSLKSRADAWNDLEVHLEFHPYVTYEDLKKHSHALQAKVFSYVDQALTPSTDKNYTGSLDSFTRVILMAAGLLSSDDFESCDFIMKEMLEQCEQLGPGARDAFEVLDTLRTLDLAPHIRELLAAPHIATLASLECIARQRESYNVLHELWSVYMGERQVFTANFLIQSQRYLERGSSQEKPKSGTLRVMTTEMPLESGWQLMRPWQ